MLSSHFNYKRYQFEVLVKKKKKNEIILNRHAFQKIKILRFEYAFIKSILSLTSEHHQLNHNNNENKKNQLNKKKRLYNIVRTMFKMSGHFVEQNKMAAKSPRNGRKIAKWQNWFQPIKMCEF